MPGKTEPPPSAPGLPPDAGILLCGHGSRSPVAEREFAALVARLRQHLPGHRVAHGFLEHSAPNLHSALDELRQSGARRVLAIPAMLFLATHARNDIPAVLCTYMDKHPDLPISYGRELGLHPQMVAAFEQRILDALGLDAPPAGGLHDWLLVVVGRGTSVASANAEVARLCRLVGENLGFGWASTVYAGITWPSVGVGLQRLRGLGFKKVLVAPYFLFAGSLIRRIHNYVERAQQQHGEVEYRMADYLREHPLVIDSLVARAAEIPELRPEDDLLRDFAARRARGEVHAHHHHAEHGNHGKDGHQPHHKQAPYRHIAHPLGPSSMVDEGLCCCFMNQLPDELVAQVRARKAAASKA